MGKCFLKKRQIKLKNASNPAIIVVISSDLTDLCDSELRGILEYRHTGLTLGDRRLRSYSHTAAGTASRGNQEDRLRTKDSRHEM